MKPRILILILVLLVAPVVTWWALAPPSAPAPPVRPYAESADAHAIDAALAFLLRHGDFHPESWQVYALLDYLQRRFQLDPRYRIGAAFPEENHPDYDRDMIALVKRLAAPDFVADLERIEAEENWLMEFMARAMYCDHFPVDEAFEPTLLAGYEEDLERPEPGYIATHIILCFQWLLELGCSVYGDDLDALFDDFADTLVAIVEREEAETDLAFEAMAFLYYIGYGDHVRPEWIDVMRALQRPTGGWGYRPQDGEHGHPTVLALWVLLENALPDAPRVPWLLGAGG